MIAVLCAPLNHPWAVAALGLAFVAIVFGSALIRERMSRIAAFLVATVSLAAFTLLAPRLGVCVAGVLFLVAVIPVAWMDFRNARVPIVPVLFALAGALALLGSASGESFLTFVILLNVGVICGLLARTFRVGLGFGDVILCSALFSAAMGFAAVLVLVLAVGCELLSRSHLRHRGGSAFTAGLVACGLLVFLLAPHSWTFTSPALGMLAIR